MYSLRDTDIQSATHLNGIEALLRPPAPDLFPPPCSVAFVLRWHRGSLLPPPLGWVFHQLVNLPKPTQPSGRGTLQLWPRFLCYRSWPAFWKMHLRSLPPPLSIPQPAARWLPPVPHSHQSQQALRCPTFPRHGVTSVPPKGTTWLMRGWTLWLMTSRQWAHIPSVLGKVGRAPTGLQPLRDTGCWDTLSLPLFLTWAPAFHRLVVPVAPQTRFSLFRGSPASHGPFLLCDASFRVAPPLLVFPGCAGRCLRHCLWLLLSLRCSLFPCEFPWPS